MERTFRDIIESWLLFEHGRSGHHTFYGDTTTNRDADTTWEAGGLFYNTTTDTLQFLESTGPNVWNNLTFPSGTRMCFQQTAAPPGWTKVTDAAYSNAAIRLISGTVTPTGGTIGFTDAFAQTTLTQANLPVVNFTGTSGSEGAHNHRMFAATVDNASTIGSFPDYVPSSIGNPGGLLDYAIRPAGAADAVAVYGLSGPVGAHTHSLSVSSGGSATPLNLGVKYVDFIIAQKD